MRPAISFDFCPRLGYIIAACPKKGEQSSSQGILGQQAKQLLLNLPPWPICVYATEGPTFAAKETQSFAY
jgi:hypothetical protein